MERIGSFNVGMMPLYTIKKAETKKDEVTSSVKQVSVNRTDDTKAIQSTLDILSLNARAGIKKVSKTSSLENVFAPSPYIKNGIGDIRTNLNQFKPSPVIRGFGTI